MLLSLFGVVLGVYVYVQKQCTDMRVEIKKEEDCVEAKIDKLQETFTSFMSQVTDRLARIETKLETNGRRKKAG